MNCLKCIIKFYYFNNCLIQTEQTSKCSKLWIYVDFRTMFKQSFFNIIY